MCARKKLLTTKTDKLKSKKCSSSKQHPQKQEPGSSLKLSLPKLVSFSSSPELSFYLQSLSPRERALFLDSLLDMNEQTAVATLERHRAYAQLIKESPGLGTLSLLTEECLARILRHLSTAELCRFALVSSDARRLAVEPSLWKRLIAKRWGRDALTLYKTVGLPDRATWKDVYASKDLADRERIIRLAISFFSSADQIHFNLNLQTDAQTDKQNDSSFTKFIPPHKLLNARRKCRDFLPPSERVVLLQDLTLFGSAKSSKLFGLQGIYFANVDNHGSGFVSWKSLMERQWAGSGCSVIERSVYDGLKEAFLKHYQHVQWLEATPLKKQDPEIVNNYKTQQQRLDLILTAVLQGFPSPNFYCMPNIPPKKLKSATKNFMLPKDEQVIALMSNDILGSITSGIIFGVAGLYWLNKDYHSMPGLYFMTYEMLSKQSFPFAVYNTIDVTIGHGFVSIHLKQNRKRLLKILTFLRDEFRKEREKAAAEAKEATSEAKNANQKQEEEAAN